MDKDKRRVRLSRREQKTRRKQQQQQQRKQQQTRHDDRSPVGESDHSSCSSTEIQPASSPQHNLNEHDSSYVPTAIPSLEDLKKENDSKPLGKWFPKAVTLKSEVSTANKEAKSALVLFYQYVEPPWSEEVVQQLLGFLCRIGRCRKLGGRIRVAPEGVNATISACDNDEDLPAATTLRYFARDLKRFHTCFEQTDFKFIEDLSRDRHFSNFKVFPVKELVFYGLKKEDAPLLKGGTHLEPEDFHKKLDDKSAVVVDVRNHYEAALGRFDGQEKECDGAEYVDPMMRKSTDFTTWLEKPETQSKLEGKDVLLYCTGGVRCERASAFLNTKMGSNVKGVYQLQGGIEGYLKKYPDGGHWRGKNFVFDKREAVSVGNHDGDGGVVRRGQRAEMIGKCCLCAKPWDRYIGKKKCDTCGVPVLMCDSCMSTLKKNPEKPLVRCPLCTQENVTVKVSDLEYTDNGKAAKVGMKRPIGEVSASSVLKWGGGHASKKKEKRRYKNNPCKFGADCNRADCFFAHPPEWKFRQTVVSVKK